MQSTSTGAVQSEYHAALREGHFVLPWCERCERTHFYPRAVCPHCGASQLVWVEAEGRGTVHSTTVVRTRTSAHNVALVDLAEGPRMMSRIEGVDPEDVVIGMRVQATISDVDDEPLVVFTPIGGETP